jgi:AraC-like DNA-binding protein
MQVATQKLRNTRASLARIARIVGYDSEAAFSRAFKKAFGAPPAAWRRSNGELVARPNLRHRFEPRRPPA